MKDDSAYGMSGWHLMYCVLFLCVMETIYGILFDDFDDLYRACFLWFLDTLWSVQIMNNDDIYWRICLHMMDAIMNDL